MPTQHSHCIVIGAGIIGSLCALQLRQQGLEVTLIERDPDALCCSTGNAGSISSASVAPLGMPGMWKKVPGMLLDRDGPLSIQPAYALRAAPWLLRFLAASNVRQVEQASLALAAINQQATDLYRALAQQLQADDLLRFTGQLQVYTSQAARDGDAAGWALRRARGIEIHELDGAALHDLEPAVGAQFTRAVFVPGEGMVVNPQRLLHTVRQRFVAAGGTLLQAAVTQLSEQPGAGLLLETTQGPWSAQQVVIAAGAWSHRLAQQMGDHIPLQTQRGYHVVFPDSGVTLQRPVVAAEAKCFAVPMEMGLRVAGTVEFASLDAPPTQRRIDALVRHSQQIFPGLRASALTQHSDWMGNRPCLPDSLPVIGRSSRSPRVLYAFGHGHLGLTQAPMTAQIITSQVLARQAPIDLAPYRATRFH
ncbi:NAD(P)/FAD-dependent oxidoreductase [Corticibacter populi]|nr:FAD-dependent oxidoreductase [Corticibacter populi]RZS35189.1 D-amino-acid dehydrogenase [Corticibacter populi]